MVSLTRRLQFAGAAAMPFGLSLLVLMISSVPLHLPHVATIKPQFALIAVFYWSVHRPDLFPYGAAFALGLVHDLLTGAPFGLGALVLVSLRAATLSQRRFFLGKPFHVVWWGFMLFLPAASLVTWLLVCIYNGSFVPAVPVVVQSLISIALFPAVAWLFGHSQVLLLRVNAAAGGR